MSNVKIEDGYVVVPPLQSSEIKGTKCGECGMKFDYGQSYGFYCGNQRCPIQLKATF